ncbi:hypothetical protein A3D77_07020 [Candidatus Gottesmanbacteria bacterium RIFCSPHIGHO2_02_FULL_39_11]|uniref:Sortase n=1 Tax=Candidatus Gottesmanbacteria bacterium RIFCSPHIGHO2_02_FULL_39_11 TaxID=1798382 RepID=A0A1F5ZK58_9BACT|nr:MAG: hypothetical protein A3D77_07020 [Candidatus Gottesmanbacteria bacterium RIFCSPHIGHO2_02_FULL_39_11]
MSTRIHKVKTQGKDKVKKARLTFLIIGIVLLVLGFLIQNSSFIFSKPRAIVAKSNGYTPLLSYNPVKIDPLFIQSQTLPKLIRDIPTKIIIPSVGIDVGVKKAKIINGYWEVFEDTAGWGEGSAAPDEAGNVVMFAHAREGLFLPLRNVKSGQKVYILTGNIFYTYEIKEVQEVNPTDTEVIKPTQDAILTLYTCSGFADSKRLIVKAKKII